MSTIQSLGDIAGDGIRPELNRAWLNHQAAAQNVANINTPGYVGQRYVKDEAAAFQDLLGKELEKSNPDHLPKMSLAAEPGLKAVPVEELSLDTEVAEVSKAQMQYSLLLDVVVRRDQMARSVLR